MTEQPPSVGLGAFALMALALLGTSACSAKDGAGSEVASEASGASGASETASAGDDTTSVADSESEASTTNSATDTDDSTDSLTSNGGSFYAGPAGDLPPTSICDPWAQDCPEDEKCVPYASFGGTWDANKCVPLLGAGEPGEPCSSAGPVVATDSCGPSSLCFNYQEIDGDYVGTCTAFCTGQPDDPQCAAGSTCVIANEGSITLCFADCDPLADDCPDDQSCTALASGGFSCLVSLDVPEGQPCVGFNSCGPGTACIDGALVLGCEAASCCTSYCSLSEPICAPGSECVGFFAEPPPAYEDLGVCLIPD